MSPLGKIVRLTDEDINEARQFMPSSIMVGSAAEIGFAYGVKSARAGLNYVPDPGLGGGVFSEVVRGFNSVKNLTDKGKRSHNG